jgi:hypothetical protein
MTASDVLQPPFLSGLIGGLLSLCRRSTSNAATAAELSVAIDRQATTPNERYYGNR